MYFSGVDIGGTFTNCVAVDESGHVFHRKAISSHTTSLGHGVIDGLERLAEEIGTTVERLLSDPTGSVTAFARPETVPQPLLGHLAPARRVRAHR